MTHRGHVAHCRVGGERLFPGRTAREAKRRGKTGGQDSKLALNKVTLGKTYLIQTTVSRQTAKGKVSVPQWPPEAGGRRCLISGIKAVARGGHRFVGRSPVLQQNGGTMTGNKQIDLPAETVLSFQLTESITLR